MRRSMEEQEQFYDDYWCPIEKNAGYDKQTNSYDVSPFIRDYLGIKERRLTAMKEIYQEFKDYVEKRGQIASIWLANSLGQEMGLRHLHWSLKVSMLIPGPPRNTS